MTDAPKDWPDEAADLGRRLRAISNNPAANGMIQVTPTTMWRILAIVDGAAALAPFVAARVAAAEEAAARGMRETAAQMHERRAHALDEEASVTQDGLDRVQARATASKHRGYAKLIRALPLPTSPLAAAEQSADDPQWDGTDAAHPAWWRGNDRGVEAVVQIVNAVLDGQPPGTHGSAALTALVQRVAAAEEASARAMRDQCKRAALDVLIPDDASAAEVHGRSMASMEAAFLIAALPLPTAALAAREKAAKVAGMREAAGLCRRDASLARQDLNFDVARGVDHAEAAIERAILALAEKEVA